MENTNYNTNPWRHHRHNREHGMFRFRTFIIGGVIILGGLLLLARNTGFLDPAVTRIIFSWEMLLIVIGVVNLLSRRSIGPGLILISVGLFFLLVNFYHMPFSTWQIFWPIVIIFIGLGMIFGPRCKHKVTFENKVTEGSEDFFEDVAIFGGVERRVVTNTFKGGKVVALFGGSKIDLTQSQLDPTVKPFIESVTIFGGTTLLVPSDWNIKMEVFSIFGGYGDKRILGQIDLNKTVVVKGVAIFGGGEIKSY